MSCFKFNSVRITFAHITFIFNTRRNPSQHKLEWYPKDQICVSVSFVTGLVFPWQRVLPITLDQWRTVWIILAISHYCDVIMKAMACHIVGVLGVCSAVCSGADQRKHQSSASLAFVRGINRWLEFPSQRTSNAGNVSIWYRHHETWWVNWCLDDSRSWWCHLSSYFLTTIHGQQTISLLSHQLSIILPTADKMRMNKCYSA